MNWLDAKSLIEAFGTIGIALILFAETGLLIGLFLPGDTLLFTAGLLCTTSAASTVHLSLPLVLIAAIAGALIGAQVGYLIGRAAGPRLLMRPDRPRLRDAVERAEQVLARYGYGKAIVLARFLPLVRTVMNPLAGVLHVPARTFTLWNVLGGLLWTIGLVLAGYALGSSIENIDRYLLPMVVVILILSLIPILLEARGARRRTRA